MAITITHTCWDADRIGFICPACQAARDAIEAAKRPLTLEERIALAGL